MKMECHYVLTVINMGIVGDVHVIQQVDVFMGITECNGGVVYENYCDILHISCSTGYDGKAT